MIHPVDGNTNASMVAPQMASSLEVDSQVAARVSVLLRLNERSLKSAHERFNLSNQTLSSLFSLNFVFTMMCIPTGFVLMARFAICDTAVDYFLVSAAATAIAAIGVGLWGFYWRQKAIISKLCGHLPDQSRRHIQRVQKALFLFTQLMFCYRLYKKSIAETCPGPANYVANYWDCNPTADSHALPQELSLLVMFTPLTYFVSVRGAHFEYSMSLWAITVVTLFAGIIAGDCWSSIYYVVAYMMCSLFILYEVRKQNFTLFFTHEKLHEFLREKEKAADAANEQEMRHMIANVAHDLKTPLASFLCGVDFIAHVVAELRGKRAAGAGAGVDALSASAEEECLESMAQCATSMRNTNSFMLMTINRCIDFTKASKGVKLVPKNETIDLMETLSLPLNCMKDIQQRVTIRLEPIPANVCKHVITDKQWLQENVLCLLSNAVKYSSGGEVSITVQVVGGEGEGDGDGESKGESDGASESVATLFGAGQASSRKGAQCEQTVCAGPEPACLRVEVEDHGIGLSVEAMASLFSPFKQAQRLAGGTGLGLFSLAKRVEALGGLYGVQRRRDGQEGSLFWFQIPYRPDVSAASSTPTVLRSLSATLNHPMGLSIPSFLANGRPVNGRSSLVVQMIQEEIVPSRGTLSAPSSSKRRSTNDVCLIAPASSSVLKIEETLLATTTSLDVLVVDDSPAILKLTAMALTRQKHRVHVATNGADAVRMVQEQLEVGRMFDVILMDLQMPVMDGLEATKRLRALEASHEQRRRSGSLLCATQSLSSSVSQRITAPGCVAETGIALRHVIIGVSANSDTEIASEVFDAGADAFMAKPFALNAFYRTYDMVREQRSGVGV